MVIIFTPPEEKHQHNLRAFHLETKFTLVYIYDENEVDAIDYQLINAPQTIKRMLVTVGLNIIYLMM